MAKVMIKCPATSHAISTGVEVDSDADFNNLLHLAYHVDCPLCRNNHLWVKHDAWIAEPPEPRRRQPQRRSLNLHPGNTAVEHM